ncbi:Jerky -like protein-like [Trichinella papuae]|uniref:Jerky-like protein-like n=1 Tax=Trichinella papuae TaxID=268474 RepID=A0A0V1NAB5_9BILA|nr:Jerky -like protein-like [Trichinella papuae]
MSERVTLCCCANVTGNDHLQLSKAKSKRPRAMMISVQELLVVYDYQPKAWMTRDFSRWYDEIFVPHVKKYQHKTKNQERCYS